MRRALVVLCVCSLLLATPLQLWADTAGPTFAGTGADDASIGTIAWGSPGNITASDDIRSQASDFAVSVSHYLKGTNFSFAIPSGSTVDGVTCEVEQHGTFAGSASLPNENSIRLVNGAGTIVGDNKSTNAALPSGAGAEAFISYGGAADNWNASLTDADVNDIDFGCVFAVDLNGTPIPEVSNALVDSMRITVNFTPVGTKLLITQQTRMAGKISWVN